jgi:small redox-active disulfide protein 2
MLDIKVLGSGCPNCERLASETRATLDDAGMTDYALTKITDMASIVGYGVLSTPALVINEVIVSSGKIPKRKQILAWVQERSEETT